MDSFDISGELNLNVNPEYKLLNYVTWASDILNCEQSWNIDSLCLQMEQIDLDGEDDIVPIPNDNLIILDSTEVKYILLSDSEIKRNLEVFVKVLLEFVSNKIENFEKGVYQQIVPFVNEICRFVKACEKNNIIIPIKTHVIKFLNGLFCILGTVHTLSFMAPFYQPIAKIIGSFKKIEFAKSFIIVEISKKLKSFYSLMETTPTNNFDLSYYEILLFYLMILQDVLEYNLKCLVLTPTNVNKKEDNMLMDINLKLTIMLDKLPHYVAFIAENCLNLL